MRAPLHGAKGLGMKHVQQNGIIRKNTISLIIYTFDLLINYLIVIYVFLFRY